MVEVERGREEERRGGDIMVEIERERREKRRKGGKVIGNSWDWEECID